VTQVKELFAQIDGWVMDILMSDRLTKTDHRLFWYLFKLDRFGDRFVELPSQGRIALDLGVSRKAINESQAKLQSLGLWDFGVSKWKGRNLSAKRISDDVTKKLQVGEKGDSQSPKSYSQQQKGDSQSPKSDNDSPKSYTPESEMLTDKSSQTPSDYSDFMKTLSEEKRASFLKFCKEKTKNLIQEVNDIEAWLANKSKAGQNRWQVYYQKFQDERLILAKQSQTDGRNLVEEFHQELAFTEQKNIQLLKQKMKVKSCQIKSVNCT